MTNDTIIVKSLNISYLISGDLESKSKVLILHGWNQTGSTSWQTFLEQNQDQLIIAVDLPCFGASDCPNTTWNTQDYVNFCLDLVDNLDQKYKLQNSKWNLVGHSFGGAIASLLSLQNPNKINSLSLVAPALIRRKMAKKQQLIQKITKLFNLVGSLPILNLLKPVATKIWYKIIGSPDYNLTGGVKRQIMQTILKDDLTSQLKPVIVPILLVWGTADTYTPFSDFSTVKNLLKPTKTIIYKDYKHGIHIQNSSGLYHDISNFIKNL